MSYRFVPAIAVALFLTACGGTIPLAAAPAAPGAGGLVRAAEGAQGSLEITLEVERLAAAEKVVPGATVYVVWATPTGKAPQNLGALIVGEDMKGRLETVTALHGFELFITAEEVRMASEPSGPRVLSAHINR